MAIVKPKPHVSAALSHLRFGVSAAAATLAICATIQLLIFGFVHFTRARFAEPTHETAPISVVATAPAHAPGTTPLATTNGVALPPTGFQAAVVPRALSEWDASMHTLSDMTISAGVVSGLLLSIFCILGVVIAGGAGVPGVERAVSAATWALLVAAACLPWHDIMPSMMFRGAFGDYSTMTSLSDEVDAGAVQPIPMFAAYLVAPLACVCGSLLVLWRFRQALAEGVILTSVSELDERLEREISNIRVGGVTGQPNARAVAALNNAIGDRPGDDPDGPIPHNGAAGRKPRSSLSRLGRGWVNGDGPDTEFKRPI